MKKSNRYLILILVGASLFFGSCAERVDENFTAMENLSLSEWMKKNRPDIPKAEEGLYYKIYKTEESQDVSVERNNWVGVLYTGQALNGSFPEKGRFTGDYYENLYPGIARQLGTFSYFCHYVPLMVYNNELIEYTLTRGGSSVLKQMQLGDSAEIFMTSAYAYGSGGYFSSFDGFLGNKELEGNKPVYMTMKLKEIIEDPVKVDKEKTIAYAEEVLGIPAQDSIKENLYLDITLKKPEEAKISDDTTITIWYVAKFTDGFVFDTNIESVAKEHNIYYTASSGSSSTGTTTHSYSPFTVTFIDGESESIVQGLVQALKHMRVGEKATTVFSSSWGYGATGDSNGKTLIQPYTPLVFDVEIIKKEDE